MNPAAFIPAEIGLNAAVAIRSNPNPPYEL
jgi:hypothetical protein